MGETPIQIFGNLSKNLDAGAEIVRSKEHRVASDAVGSIVDDAVFRRRFGLGNAGRKRINELTMMVCMVGTLTVFSRCWRIDRIQMTGMM